MSNRIVTRYASLLLAAFVIGACQDDEPTGVDTLPFDVSPISFALDLGGTKQMKITGIAISDVTWESTNPAVASVSSTGVVTGVSVGTVAITARSKANPTTDLASATFQVNAVFGTQINRNQDYTVAGVTGTQVLYRVFVPEGTTQLQVTIRGTNGDADVYTRFGTPPTFSKFDCRPWLGGSNETCTHASPAEGSWYIWIDAYDGYSNLTLRASTTP
jgi:hypothetical protein